MSPAVTWTAAQLAFDLVDMSGAGTAVLVALRRRCPRARTRRTGASAPQGERELAVPRRRPSDSLRRSPSLGTGLHERALFKTWLMLGRPADKPFGNRLGAQRRRGLHGVVVRPAGPPACRCRSGRSPVRSAGETRVDDVPGLLARSTAAPAHVLADDRLGPVARPIHDLWCRTRRRDLGIPEMASRRRSRRRNRYDRACAVTGEPPGQALRARRRLGAQAARAFTRDGLGHATLGRSDAAPAR